MSREQQYAYNLDIIDTKIWNTKRFEKDLKTGLKIIWVVNYKNKGLIKFEYIVYFIAKT